MLSLTWGEQAALAQEEPAGTPAPTASPTPSPPDPMLAAELARQGKVEGAIAAYVAVIEQGSARDRIAAHLPLARLYLDDGQTAAAVRTLDALLLEAPPGADVRGAQYLLAEALAIQGEWADALPVYDAYIDGGGGASTYARLGRAEALARTGRGLDASIEAERLLAEEELPDGARLPFILAMAQALEAGNPQEALDWYERLRRESDVPVDDALALWRSAQIEAELAGRQPSLSVALEIVQRYPETPIALEVVEDFPITTAILDGYDFARVYYLNGETARAREMFESLLQVEQLDSNTARAAFYLAVLDERAGDFDAAIAGYGRVLVIDDGVEVADDALWWRARLLEQEARLADARKAYAELIDRFGGSEFAPEARFRLALLGYDTLDYAGAADAFAAIADGTRGEERQRALLWQGKSLDAAGDGDAAKDAWQAARDEAPAAYYGLRAAVLLGEAQGDLGDGGLSEAHEPDWPAIERWLRDATGEDPAVALETVLYDQHWGLAQELLALGMRRRAGGELTLLLEEARRDPARLYQLARLASSAGLYELSARAATRLLGSLPDGAADGAPADLRRLAYPAPFAELVREAADASDVPDLLLLALVRQESFFDPLAGSSAGALGLTQVVPETGAAIARDLEITGFETEQLFRPALSLRFGAHYLGEQLGAFKGNVYQALAAYNAGPGSAQRWQVVAGDDVDRFVEQIDFAQTKAYLQLVSENLARYRQLYQGLDGPSLPEE
jgi:soluble lytic murein transglycosylase